MQRLGAVVALACGVHAYHALPRGVADRAVSHRIARLLGVGEAAERRHRFFPHRQAEALQTESPLGLRVLPVYQWLDDPLHTCQEETPAARLQEMATRAGGVPVSESVLYSTQRNPRVRVFNRDGGSNLYHEVECTRSRVLDSGMKGYVTEKLLPELLSYFNTLLAARYSGSGGLGPLQGNDASSEPFCQDASGVGRCMRCNSDHFVFHLPPPYRFESSDLILFVTAEPDWSPAWATPCTFATDGRPTSMILNLSPSEMRAAGESPRGLEMFQAHAMQALFHGLGFTTSLFPSWRVNGDPYYTVPALYGGGTTVNVVTTPAVIRFLETVQFRCQGHPKGGTGRAHGAELEDALLDSKDVLPYWDRRVFKGEILTMLPDVRSELEDIPVVSGLTIAVMEDTGWYVVERRLAQRLPWLFEQPCKDAGGSCTEWSPRYRCAVGPDTPAADITVGCSSDFTAVGTCNGFAWPPGRVPDKFRRYNGQGVLRNWAGGDPLGDFCAFNEPGALAGASCLSGSALCASETCPQFSVRGTNSRCVTSNLTYEEFSSGSPAASRGTCLPHSCMKLGVPEPGQPQLWRAVFNVAGHDFACEQAGAVVGPSVGGAKGSPNCRGDVVVGTITCPDPRELCEEAGEAVLARACDPRLDCSGHGYCSPEGACVCFTEMTPAGFPRHGAWGGLRCSRCLDGWTGVECRSRACALTQDGEVCGGHGVCRSSGRCECFANETHGWWGVSSGCTDCAAGRSGGSCKLDACVSDTDCLHGVCSQGAVCDCHRDLENGFWLRGDRGRCDRCARGYDHTEGCRVRIASFYGCDANAASDHLASAECMVECSNGDAVPQRPPAIDERGCLVSRPPPKCRGHVQFAGTQPGLMQCTGSDPCPSPSEGGLMYNCKGYPNPYTDCWLANECRCGGSPRLTCLAGTEAVRPVGAVPQTHRAGGDGIKPGPQDERGYVTPAEPARRVCRCPAPRQVAKIDCWGPLADDPSSPTGTRPVGPPRVRGRVVFFEPRQLFEEDFCQCTSPPIPQCSDETRPQRLPQRTQGRRLDCREVLEEYGCPDWHTILNIAQQTDSSAPDLSLIDCDGWPPPKLVHHQDACGCSFPRFTCIPGTEGVCGDPPDCPAWDPLPQINCRGQMPPVLNRHAPHPCGCPPPPPPICIPGTQRGSDGNG
eukprot:Hpha_TRINITY_DN11783_c0_g2::TRINITY_DN11783_c0_g2_i1::g.31888::m.31888